MGLSAGPRRPPATVSAMTSNVTLRPTREEATYVMDQVTELRCVVCGATYAPEPGRYTCDVDGMVGCLDVIYDYELVASRLDREVLTARRDPTIWRYVELMPLMAAPDHMVPVGGTPLVEAESLASRIGVGRVQVKDDGRQPSASLKDRASAVATAKAMEFGSEVIATASTGNAAAALAAVTASVGLPAVIFVPAAAPQAKIAQLLAYGSAVVLVDGTYGDAFDLCQAASETFGWFNRNTGVNPYVAEGKKTVSLEILEQRGWQPPDAIFVSVGDGSIIGGVAKGLRDALRLGWIDRMPQVFGIQAAGSDYLVQAFENGEDVVTKPEIEANTVADSIWAGLPRDRVKALAAVVDSGGQYLRVTDDEILAAIPTLAASTGVFAEPAAAAAWAGAEVASRAGHLSADSDIVIISTGSGLKDVPAAMRAVADAGREGLRVSPDVDLEELRERLS